MGKIFVGGKQFTPPPTNPTTESPPEPPSLPLNKIEVDLRHKLDKLEQDLKVDDDDLYKILSKLRNQRKLQIVDQLDQIQLFKSKQNVYLFDYINSKTQELKQKELLYHR